MNVSCNIHSPSSKCVKIVQTIVIINKFVSETRLSLKVSSLEGPQAFIRIA